MPRWLARVNRRVFNPLELRRGVRPVLRHVGRVSGAVYRTPLETLRTADGYAVVLVYGPRTDWLRNVLVSGGCELEVGDRIVALTNPRVVALDDVTPVEGRLPSARMRRVFGFSECLVLDEVS